MAINPILILINHYYSLTYMYILMKRVVQILIFQEHCSTLENQKKKERSQNFDQQQTRAYFFLPFFRTYRDNSIFFFFSEIILNSMFSKGCFQDYTLFVLSNFVAGVHGLVIPSCRTTCISLFVLYSAYQKVSK